MYKISHTSCELEKLKEFEIPVIDVAATSNKLKALRVERNLKVSDLQNLFGFENPQAVYSWENETCKILPRIDNLVTLAKLYNVRIDEIIVVKNAAQDAELVVKENLVPFAASEQTLEFVKRYASLNAIRALERYYDVRL